MAWLLKGNTCYFPPRDVGGLWTQRGSAASQNRALLLHRPGAPSRRRSVRAPLILVADDNLQTRELYADYLSGRPPTSTVFLFGGMVAGVWTPHARRVCPARGRRRPESPRPTALVT